MKYIFIIFLLINLTACNTQDKTLYKNKLNEALSQVDKNTKIKLLEELIDIDKSDY